MTEQIIVLDDGKIAGIGTHKELLRNCEVYKQIAASQLSEKELQDGMQSEDRKNGRYKKVKTIKNRRKEKESKSVQKTAETGGEKINPGVKKNRETDGESGVRVGVEAFRRDFYGGFNIRKCKKFVVLLHHGSLQRMRSGKGFALCAWRRIGIKNIKI